MKTLNSDWLRRFGLFLAGTALTLTAFCAGSKSALSGSISQKIAEKIQTLQKSEERWIQIDLSRQRLIAWEGRKPVYAVIISTGKRSTPTRIGTFAIQSKHRSTRMRGDDYDIPNVPHTMFYYGGYAIHGAFWHRRFGTPVSHGCVNMALDHAKWLFKWAKVGTPVVVQR